MNNKITNHIIKSGISHVTLRNKNISDYMRKKIKSVTGVNIPKNYELIPETSAPRYNTVWTANKYSGLDRVSQILIIVD